MDSKKIAAAALGVIEYLKEEKEREESMRRTVPGASSGKEYGREEFQGSLWATAGRVSNMQVRSLMQYGAFRG